MDSLLCRTKCTVGSHPSWFHCLVEEFVCVFQAQDMLPYCLLETLSFFPFHIQISNPPGIDFSVYYELEIKIQIISYGSPIDIAPFIEKAIVSQWLSCGTSVINQVFLHVWICF